MLLQYLVYFSLAQLDLFVLSHNGCFMLLLTLPLVLIHFTLKQPYKF